MPERLRDAGSRDVDAEASPASELDELTSELLLDIECALVSLDMLARSNVC